MNPDEPVNPPSAPEPETNPVPPPEPQPEQAAEPAAVVTEAAPATGQSTSDDGKFPSAFSLFKPSWAATKLNFWTFVLIYVALLAAIGIAVGIAAASYAASKPVGAVLSVILALAIIYLCAVAAPATVHVQLKSSKGEKAGFKDAFDVGQQFAGRSVLLGLLVGLMVIGGLILLIVPGIFMIKRYYLSNYVLVDRNVGAREAMRQSRELSSRNSGAVWGLLGVSLLIQLPNIIPVLGRLITAVLGVLYYCAPALRYRQLNELAPAPVKA